MRTAKEAFIKSVSKSAIEKLEKAFFDAIEKATSNGEIKCEVLYYDDTIGDVGVLYSRGSESECLTDAGKVVVQKMRELGYTVSLHLYYEELQFVDMRLEFHIDWSKPQ